MDEMNRTIIDTNGGWGGAAWGAGVGYDTGAINAIQEQLGNVQTQIANADRDMLMQTSNQNQFVGNLVNQTGDAIVGAVTSGNQAAQNAICNLGQNVQAGIFQNTLSQTQNSNATNMAMAQGFGGLNASIAQQGFNNQLAIVEQNGANRLQAQQLASQQQQCCCQVLRSIEQEGCANRELQREIQYQNTRDELAKESAENQALKAQLFTVNAMAQQTQAIINALKPTTTTGA